MIKRFRIRSSKLFLTYPQCDVTKEDMYNELIEMFTPKEILVAHERHANGDSHLHCYLELPESREFESANFADVNGFHGNYQGCRSAKNVLKYCSKGDDYCANFDVAAVLTNGKSAKTIVGRRLIEGKDLVSTIQEFPQYLFGYKNLKADLQSYQEDVKTDERDDLPADIPNPWGERMPVDTDKKRCHYWVYSKSPNRGKTSAFLEPLYKQYKAYWHDQNEPYWSISEKEEIIIIDELLRGQIRHGKLNAICDGHAKFRIFNGGCISLLAKPIVIVCSNFSIQDVFPIQYLLVQARFNEIEIL